MSALLASLLLAAAWPAPWAEKLEKHFGVQEPVALPPEAVDATIAEWLEKRPLPLEIMQNPRWQTDQVFLLDEAQCAKIAARVNLHSVFRFDGHLKAVLLGRKRFAFVYDKPERYHLPEYAVYGSDSYEMGALNLGTIQAGGIADFEAFDEKGAPRPVKGPLGVTLKALWPAGNRIRAVVKVFPDTYVPAVRVEPPPGSRPDSGPIQAK